MALSNFNGYSQEQTINFEGLNMLSTVFSVIIAIFNCYLASMVIDNYWLKAFLTFGVFGLVQYTII
jgi:intracellular septation protein A